MAEIVRTRVLHQGWSTFRLIDVRLDDGDVVLTWRVPRARVVEVGWDCAVVAPEPG